MRSMGRSTSLACGTRATRPRQSPCITTGLRQFLGFLGQRLRLKLRKPGTLPRYYDRGFRSLAAFAPDADRNAHAKGTKTKTPTKTKKQTGGGKNKNCKK